MKNLFSGSDFGVLVFGRAVLKQNNTAHIDFEIKKNSPHIQEKYWEKGLQDIIKQTKFGRLGLVYERKNSTAKDFISQLKVDRLDYKPLTPRAEKKLNLKPFETQILWELAHEGFTDSVEFRRIARKYIRRTKNAHRDTLFFLDSILGEEKTRKILQHLAGTQIKLYFPSDFVEIKSEKNKKREVKILTDEDLSFTHQRAEEILRTKISKENIHRIRNHES